jgi:hypothetical protein
MSNYWSGIYECIPADGRLTYYAKIDIELFWNELVKLEIICDGC